MWKAAVILGAGARPTLGMKRGLLFSLVGARRSLADCSDAARRFGLFYNAIRVQGSSRLNSASLHERAETLKRNSTNTRIIMRTRSAIIKEVPAYVRDLINEVVSTYTKGENPGSHLRLVLNLFGAGIQVAFIVLNYDDYVELALAQCDRKLVILGMNDYVGEGRQAIVCKVHGSVNWGVSMDDGSDWWKAVLKFDPGKAGKQIVLGKSRKPTPSWSHDGEPLYPVLTAPLAGKGYLDLVCPHDHLDALRSFLRNCHDYLFVGTSMQDEDPLAYLRETVKSVNTVHLVNGDPKQVETSYMRLIGACPRFAGGGPDARVLYRGGFREYLAARSPNVFWAPDCTPCGRRCV